MAVRLRKKRLKQEKIAYDVAGNQLKQLSTRRGTFTATLPPRTAEN
jgi:hypothetical protein